MDPNLTYSSAPSQSLQLHSSDIVKQWLSELDSAASVAHLTKSQLQSAAKSILTNVICAVDTTPLPESANQLLNPLLQRWHQLITHQSQAGMSAKDTAVLLMSLKSTLTNWQTAQPHSTADKWQSILRWLDVLGLLTFEIYATEKESQIYRQNNQIQYLQAQQSITHYHDLIGSSPPMQRVFQAIGLILENDVTVLLEGESGTGKDVIASTIHRNSKRKSRPFVILNCGAIPKDLVESELFGHEKGAFTGADHQRLGKFELADTGTLFLDEIGELPLDLQVKLLRVLQNREIERIGGTKKIPINVRIIAATNKHLQGEVDTGRFRLDLFYRLCVFPIYIPPLRDRGDDIIRLALHLIEKFQKTLGVRIMGLTDDAKSALLSHPWKGNVRELENTIQRGCIIANGGWITADTLHWTPGHPTAHFALPLGSQDNNSIIMTLMDVEKQAISRALEITGYNIKQTAAKLGISRTTLYNKARKYGIAVQ